MAETDFRPAPKAHVYDLLARLNAAFARVQSNTRFLEQTGLFDPQTIDRIHNMTQECQADANCNLLEILRGIEGRDRAEFGRMRE